MSAEPREPIADGAYTVTFPGGDGDYMVSFASLGYGAKRFEVKRSADEDILVADTKLDRIGAILDPVKVTAERQKVQRKRTALPTLAEPRTARTIPRCRRISWVISPRWRPRSPASSPSPGPTAATAIPSWASERIRTIRR